MGKIAIINDTHFGARNDNPIFLEHFMQFFEKVFFPYMRMHDIRNVIHLGDLMDRRKYVNFSTLNVVQKRFVTPLLELGITLDILPGNHDVFYKNTNEVNSIHELFYHSGLCHNWNFYFEPRTVEIKGLRIGMVPWITKANEKECLDFIAKKDAQILMGHFELSGYEVLRGVEHHDGMDPSILSGYDAVYSGHFHCKHSKGNIHYLGTQYQITFGDLHEPKGFHVIDTDTGEVEYIQNPMRLFTQFTYNDEEHQDFFDGSIDWNYFKKTFVRLVIEKKTNPFMLDRVIDKLNEEGSHSVSIIDQTQSNKTTKTEEKVDLSKDTLSLICEEIDRTEGIEDPTRLKNIIRELYMEAQSV